MKIEMIGIDDDGEQMYQDHWVVKNGDLINLTVGDRTVVIRIDKRKIAYVVIEKNNKRGMLEKQLGEIDLYE